MHTHPGCTASLLVCSFISVHDTGRRGSLTRGVVSCVCLGSFCGVHTCVCVFVGLARDHAAVRVRLQRQPPLPIDSGGRYSAFRAAGFCMECSNGLCRVLSAPSRLLSCSALVSRQSFAVLPPGVCRILSDVCLSVYSVYCLPPNEHSTQAYWCCILKCGHCHCRAEWYLGLPSWLMHSVFAALLVACCTDRVFHRHVAA